MLCFFFGYFKSIVQQNKMAVLGQQFSIPGTTEKVKYFLIFISIKSFFF
jgi:hypothetical protein